MCTIQIMTSFSWDEYFKWDRYAVCLPVTRTEIVMSKYILLILFSFIGTCLSLVLALGISFIKGQNIFGNIFEIILSMFLGSFVITSVVSLIIPLIYKFGVEKSRIVMMSIFLIFSLVFILAMKKLENLNFNNINHLAILTFIFSVIIFIVSFRVSCIIYKNKEV